MIRNRGRRRRRKAGIKRVGFYQQGVLDFAVILVLPDEINHPNWLFFFLSDSISNSISSSHIIVISTILAVVDSLMRRFSSTYSYYSTIVVGISSFEGL